MDPNSQPAPYTTYIAPEVIPNSHTRRSKLPIIGLVVLLIIGVLIGLIFLMSNTLQTNELSPADKIRVDAVDSFFEKIDQAATDEGKALSFEEVNAIYDEEFQSFSDPDGSIFGLGDDKEQLPINTFYYGLTDQEIAELCTQLSNGDLYCKS